MIIIAILIFLNEIEKDMKIQYFIKLHLFILTFSFLPISAMNFFSCCFGNKNKKYTRLDSDQKSELSFPIPKEIFTFEIVPRLNNTQLNLLYAYSKKLTISPIIALNIVTALKEKSTRTLCNHTMIDDPYTNQIFQNNRFKKGKVSFLSKVASFCKSCPAHNKKIIEQHLDNEIQHLFPDSILAIPIDKSTQISVTIVHEHLSFIQKALLMVIGCSRDEKTKTAAFVYDTLHDESRFKKDFPTIDWKNAPKSPLPPDSPYAK